MPPKIEILAAEVETPPVRDVTPGWIGRNRTALTRGRQVARALMLVSPPPVRIALGAVSVAADAMLLSDDLRRRGEAPTTGGLRAGALALEGVALLAISRYAPARLAANLAGIETVRQSLERVLARGERA